MAVHSYKDLPTAPDPRFVIAAIPPREDARDALVARDGLVLGELPAGSVIGTSSPRRAAQLRALGLGLEIRPLRGNLDTRLNRVSSGDLDGVVVARAGLARIGRLDDVTETLEPVQMLPAPAQGALAVECRAGDTELAALLAELDDADTRAAVTAERALLAELEAGCSAPVGAIAEVVESIDEDGRVFEELSLRGCVAALDGSDVIRASGIGTPDRARELGLSVAAELFELGARDLLDATDCGEREMTGQMTTRGRKQKPGRITFVGSGPGRPGPADDAGAHGAGQRRAGLHRPRRARSGARPGRVRAAAAVGTRRRRRRPADDARPTARPTAQRRSAGDPRRPRHPARARRSGRGRQDAGHRGPHRRRRRAAGRGRPAVGGRGDHRGERAGAHAPALRDRAGPARHARPCRPTRGCRWVRRTPWPTSAATWTGRRWPPRPDR